MKADLLSRQQQAVFSLDALPVSPRNKNFTIMVDIQKDDMAATVRVVTPQKDVGILEFDVLAELYRCGVRTNVNYQRISAMIADRRFNEDVMAASGFTPEKGVDASIETVLSLKEFEGDDSKRVNTAHGVEVEIDDVIMRKTPATAGVNGVSVKGRQIVAEPGRDIEIKHGNNVYLSEDGTELRAAISGVAGFVNGRPEVRVSNYEEWNFLVHFRRNKMEAVLIIYPGASAQPEITDDFIDELLNKHDIKFGVEPVLNSASLQDIKKTTVVTIASGEMPSLGRNARLIEKFRESAEPGQQVFQVNKGDVLVKKVSAEAGARGRNVLDEPIPSKKGADIPLEAGNNTTISNDGLVLTAAADGYVSKVGGVYQVVEGCSYNGANKLPARVNYPGVVNVHGDVAAGKIINAGHHIFIDGDVTGSSLLAGGVIHVRGKIDCRSAGRIQAGGDLFAGGLENAKVIAGGNIYLSGPVHGCDVVTDGSVKTDDSGSGILESGRVVAAGNADISGLGTVNKKRMILETGIPVKIRNRYDSVSKEVVKLIEKQTAYIREINKLKKNSKTRKLTGSEIELFRRLKLGYDAVSERIQLRSTTLKKLQAGMRKLSRNSRIDVRGVTYPDTVVKIGPYSKKIDKKMPPCRLTVNEEAKSITISKL